MQIRTKVGVVYDTTNWNIPQGTGDCNFSQAETDNWNNPTWEAMHTRLEAGWCSWIDWSHYVMPQPTNGPMLTDRCYCDQPGGLPSFTIDKLWNQGLEGPTSAPGIYSGPGDGYGFFGSATRYCGQGGPLPFDGNCFVQFNKGSNSWSSIYQDQSLWLPAGTRPTAEAMLRCRKGAGQMCDLQLGFWTTPTNNNPESRFASASIRDDGQWYLCRMDADHFGDAGLQYNHTGYRFEVYNNSNANMDIDYTFFGESTNHQNPDSPPPLVGPVGVNNTSVGPVCSAINYGFA
jgi:hypothetical protein